MAMQRIHGWQHVYRRDNGALYYLRRVPQDVSHIIEERQFKRSLRHRDQRLPAFKAAYDAVHREVESYIAKVREGRGAPEAHRRYDEAVLRAQRYGFDYRPMEVLASEEVGVDELIERLEAVESHLISGNRPVVDAIMGAVKKPPISLAQAVEMYEAHEKPRLKDKNEGQLQRWRNPLMLAIRNFESVTGKTSLEEITRDDALTFREWWVERLGKDVESANTANKNIMALRKVFRTINEVKRLNLQNPFDDLTIANGAPKQRVSLSRGLLETVLLPGIVGASLNADACGIIQVMADTGARLNEIAGLAPEDIRLDDEVPHILIRPNAIRTLKNAPSEREIPLVGEALKALMERPGGFPRYAGKNAGASATINKYLQDNNLLPEGASLYGLRHGYQDRLIEVEAPERIQAQLMGHKFHRPKYGKGPSLQQMQNWLQKIALQPRPIPI